MTMPHGERPRRVNEISFDNGVLWIRAANQRKRLPGRH